MFDEIIRRGTNSDGIIIGQLQSQPGPHDNVKLQDGWGYDYVAFLDYDMATGRKRYQKQVEFALSNLLKPRYKNFNWDHKSRDNLADSVEGRYKNFNWDHKSRDNLADSVEGGLYLLNRLPIEQGFQWADREVANTLVDASDPARLWETHKLEANTVRTVLIHAMMHTRNTIVRPWRQDLQLGASQIHDGIAIVIRADKPYKGLLQFDIPRHRLYMGFKKDWPRMNTMPEWFTVEPENEYLLKNVTTNLRSRHTGKQLHDGVPIDLRAGKEQCLLLAVL
jgi:hypothetical protein